MSVSASYDDTTAKVTLTIASAPTNASTALIERSTDGIRWTTVRGAQAVTIASGAATFTDYEYSAGVSNTYRASYQSPTNVAFVSAGTAATGNNASVTPGMPAGLLPGDQMVLFASIRNSGTGSPNTPTGWTKFVDGSNAVVFGRRYVTGDTAPTVAFTGGAAGADTIAQIGAFRNGVFLSSATVLNTAAQNITTTSIMIPQNNVMVFEAGWKQAVNTGVTLAGWTSIGVTSASAGSGSTNAWFYAFAVAGGTLGSVTMTVTGGTSQISRGLVGLLSLAPYIVQETGSVTPNQTKVWLKNPIRPFLNRTVTVTDPGDTTRPTKGGAFEVLGRSTPVAVTDVQGSSRRTMVVRTVSHTDTSDLDSRLVAGDVVFVHAPKDSATATIYAFVGDVGKNRVAMTSQVRLISLPLTEVAQPDVTLAAALSTWATVTGTYATWSALTAAKASWAAVLAIVGSPSDVITT